MGRKNRDYTDAEFEVIEPDQPRRKWWQGWYIDWRGFLIIAATSIAAFIARMSHLHH